MLSCIMQMRVLSSTRPVAGDVPAGASPANDEAMVIARSMAAAVSVRMPRILGERRDGFQRRSSGLRARQPLHDRDELAAVDRRRAVGGVARGQGARLA